MLELNCSECEYKDAPAGFESCKQCILATEEINVEELLKEKADNVNHPSHYCQEGSMECIDEMIAIFGIDMVKAFCLLNVWKYRKRAVFKNGEEDIKKSDWYLNKYIELGGMS